jgi:hypothetical protein
MSKKEWIERIRLEQLEIRKMMFRQYLPPNVFASLMEDIRWYNKYIRHLEETMEDE